MNLGPWSTMMRPRNPFRHPPPSCCHRSPNGPWRRSPACPPRRPSEGEMRRLFTRRQATSRMNQEAVRPAADRVPLPAWTSPPLPFALRLPPSTARFPPSKTPRCGTGGASSRSKRPWQRPRRQDSLERPCMRCRLPAPSPPRDRGVQAPKKAPPKFQCPNQPRGPWSQGPQANGHRSTAC